MAILGSPLEKIEHVVVLMMENRSFDNLLGWLYDPDNPPPFNRVPPENFEGLYGKDLWNPGPRGPVPVSKTYELNAPNPSPDTDYEDVYCQLYNVSPVPRQSMVPPDPPLIAPMTGFVNNYADVHKGKDHDAVMHCFTPESVPVLAYLAYHYAVCDHWFGSVPTETFPNRAFACAGRSSGYVSNHGPYFPAFTDHSKTIFEILEEAGKSWKVYTGGWTVTSTAFITHARLRRYILTDRFDNLAALREDASQPGGLPSYSYIEPVYIDSRRHGARNDMHPEWQAKMLRRFSYSPLEWGEILLYDVYTTLRNSPDWDKILLLIMFDEHGGCFDHVSPPAAVPPDDVVIPPSARAGSGFKFDRLGPRVPALVVSAYTPPQTIINTVFDHTSILSTLVHCFGLPDGQLGARAAKASDVSEALTLTLPRRDLPRIPKPTLVKRGVRRGMPRWWRNMVQAVTAPKLNKLQKTIACSSVCAVSELGLCEDAGRVVEDVDDADTLCEELEARVAARKPAKCKI